MDGKQGIVIVTGSSGLIGAAVVKRLAERFFVIALDREAPREPPPPDCRHIYFDVTSDETVRECLAIIRAHHGERIASAVHLAAYYDFSGEPSPKYEEVTVRGTERLLRGLGSFHVEQFLFSSTMLVHAPCEPGERDRRELANRAGVGLP